MSGESIGRVWVRARRALGLAVVVLAACAGPEPIVIYPGRDRGLWVYGSDEGAGSEAEVRAMIEANGLRLVPAPEPLPDGPRGPRGENLAPCIAARGERAPVVVLAHTVLKRSDDKECVWSEFTLHPKKEGMCLEYRLSKHFARLQTEVTVLDSATCQPLRQRVYEGVGAAATPELALREAQRAHDADAARRLPDLFVRAVAGP